MGALAVGTAVQPRDLTVTGGLVTHVLSMYVSYIIGTKFLANNYLGLL